MNEKKTSFLSQSTNCGEKKLSPWTCLNGKKWRQKLENSSIYQPFPYLENVPELFSIQITKSVFGFNSKAVSLRATPWRMLRAWMDGEGLSSIKCHRFHEEPHFLSLILPQPLVPAPRITSTLFPLRIWSSHFSHFRLSWFFTSPFSFWSASYVTGITAKFLKTLILSFSQKTFARICGICHPCAQLSLTGTALSAGSWWRLHYFQ